MLFPRLSINPKMGNDRTGRVELNPEQVATTDDGGGAGIHHVLNIESGIRQRTFDILAERSNVFRRTLLAEDARMNILRETFDLGNALRDASLFLRALRHGFRLFRGLLFHGLRGLPGLRRLLADGLHQAIQICRNLIDDGVTGFRRRILAELGGAAVCHRLGDCGHHSGMSDRGSGVDLGHGITFRLPKVG